MEVINLRAITWVGRLQSRPESVSSTMLKRSDIQAWLHILRQSWDSRQAALMRPRVAQPLCWSFASRRCSGAEMLML